jgi:Zn-dependent protease
MLFNMIPIAPLDGDKVLDFFIPDSWRDSVARIRPYGPMILLGLVFLGPYLGIDIIGSIIRAPLGFFLRLLIGV